MKLIHKNNMELYISFLQHKRHLSSSTIKSIFSAISYTFKLKESWDPTKSFRITTMLLKSYGKLEDNDEKTN